MDAPAKLDLKKDRGLTVEWADGTISYYSIAYLRRMSPSADMRQLREEMTTNPLTVLPNKPTGKPGPLDPTEPMRVADAVLKMGLKHVVITSVDRDDLADGGAAHFAAVVRAIRQTAPAATIEILTPDFLRKPVAAAESVIASQPDVFNHNLETVPRLYLSIRPGARYFHSLRLLERVKERDPQQFTKSGLMVGLGEAKEEVMQVMDDMRSASVDFLTIGQYLQPTRKHAAVDRFVPPDEFHAYEEIARAKGFLMVSASPLTRSSHHAGEDFARLKAARLARQA